jgi:fucose permease
VIVSSTTFVVAGAVIAGLGSSAIFPTNMVRFARVFGPGATRQATPIFISGTLGAASISALVGFVSSSFGSLRTGILVVMVSAVLVLVFQIIIATVFRYEPARIEIS